jgi:hypothetical protein
MRDKIAEDNPKRNRNLRKELTILAPGDGEEYYGVDPTMSECWAAPLQGCAGKISTPTRCRCESLETIRQTGMAYEESVSRQD